MNERLLAPYAVDIERGGGRMHVEATDELRDPFALDVHRIVTCTAFRRLEGKTQVFSADHHDHFRTRMTHTIEVAQLARCIARHLNVNETLSEAIALGHDLGHAPFGHAGEAALNEAMGKWGGFNHNAHSLRVVGYLEHPFPAFRGLNLTQATRAGLGTHATQYDEPGESVAPSIESQIASIADRIAYNVHDLEDAIGAEFVTFNDLANVELWKDAHETIAEARSDAPIHAIRRGVLDKIVDELVRDAIEESGSALAGIASEDDVANATSRLVQLSAIAEKYLTGLERFLLERLYRHDEVAKTDEGGRTMILTLFERFRSEPTTLPPRFQSRIESQGVDRVICDYIAGMTDRFCADLFAQDG